MVRGIGQRISSGEALEPPSRYDARDEQSLYAEALRLLRIALVDPSASFRNGQWEAIRDLVMYRRRSLLVQHTGWGKSVVYFIATALLRQRGSGPTLLISPLLSLMRNQVTAAEKLGITAATLNSSNAEEWSAIQDLLLRDKVEVLLVSPERLSNDTFRQDIIANIANSIGMFVVDKAHCISDWGHDFRPDYRRIVRILRLLPSNVPVIATTATANDRVVEDIQEQLGERLQVIRGPLVRRSLQLQTIGLEWAAPRLAWLAEHLPALPESGIIYTLTKRDADQTAAWLRTMNVSAEAYHADLSNDVREQLEQRLLNNDLKALVATVALGMGFDKPDLGFVIHYQRPGSVVHYYQQIGRAGRALENAYAILLYSSQDDEIINSFIRNSFPSEASVYAVLAALNEAPNGLTLDGLQLHALLSEQEIRRVLRFLAVEDRSPVEQFGNTWFATAVDYTFDHKRVERITDLRHAEPARMEEYAAGKCCLMQFLLNELNDSSSEPCGRCAVCLDQPIVPKNFSQELARRAGDFLKQNPVIITPKRSWPLGTKQQSSMIPHQLRPEQGYALCKWGDPGWGGLVKVGKNTHVFDARLAAALAEFIKLRWQIDPMPAWVTCVPSLRHPSLVPDLAQRLASHLQIPFLPCIQKVADTPPQKAMQNSYQQVKNLENAFTIDRSQVLDLPVLLVDDIVDSGWTFTITAGLLRAAGSGPVFPVALADSS